jgi:DNA-directed RNA polymerase subunit RPC12/RpoP
MDNPICPDRSLVLEVQCDRCGDISHLHEVAGAPKEHDITVRCATCRHAIIFRPGEIEAGFAVMRRRGWIV